MTIILGRKPGGTGGGGTPSGPAGGDLSGTYPNPDIATNSIEQSMLGGGLVAPDVLFDSTLGADAASIDTGANGIAAGYNVLEVFILARTTEAAETSGLSLTFNNDTGANYDQQRILGSNATASATASLAQVNIGVAICGANAQTGAVSVIRFTVPGYTQTTFHKVGEMTNGLIEDTAATCRADLKQFRWRNTAAITRMAIAATSGSLLAGSRLLIYGR